ncbi:MAG: trypsin-like serine protease, partial [Planktomarina sp.]
AGEIGNFTGTIVGFGANPDNGGGGTKLFATVKYRACLPSDDHCSVTLSYIAPGKNTKADACLGDSGGPLFSNGLVGISTHGLPTNSPEGDLCGSGSVFLKLKDSEISKRILKWTLDTIGS